MPTREELDRHHLLWLQRRRRLRRLLRPLPRRANLSRYPVLKWFSKYAAKASFLWSFKRSNILPALYVGSVLAFLPLYGVQALLAFGAALLFRANLTVMVGLQFITNPFTIAPIYAFTGWLGVKLMHLVGVGEHLEPALRFAQGLFVGGVVVGLATALLADLAWRLLAWEAAVFQRKLQELRQRHAERHPPPPSDPPTPPEA